MSPVERYAQLVDRIETGERLYASAVETAKEYVAKGEEFTAIAENIRSDVKKAKIELADVYFSEAIAQAGSCLIENGDLCASCREHVSKAINATL